MAHESFTTTDHTDIQAWVEERGGRPSIVEGTDVHGGGLLRIDFGDQDDRLQEISWEEFFEIFDENNLAFLYQEETADGEQSRFCKFVEREA